MMVHSLAPATTLKLPIPNNTTTTFYPPFLIRSQVSINQTQDQSPPKTRRNVAVGLVSAAVGSLMNIGRESRDASAAGKRPPPPPPKEKKDPSVTGVLAKYLASKKRKEAMKDAVAKLRERGKAVDEP